MNLRPGVLIAVLALVVAYWGLAQRPPAVTTARLAHITAGEIESVRQALRDAAPIAAQLDRSMLIEELAALQLRLSDFDGCLRSITLSRDGKAQWMGYDLVPTIALAILNSENAHAALERALAAMPDLHVKLVLSLAALSRERREAEAAREWVALAQAAQESLVDAYQRATALCAIATVQQELGLPDDARRSLDDAVRFAETIGDTGCRTRKSVLETVARLRENLIAGDGGNERSGLGGQQKVHRQHIAARLTSFGKTRSQTIIGVLLAQVRAGDLPAALKGIGHLSGVDRHYAGTQIVSAILDETRDLPAVEETLTHLSQTTAWGDSLLVEFCVMQAERGKVAAAIAAATRIADASRRTEAKLRIATGLARDGKMSSALQLLDQNQPPSVSNDYADTPARLSFDFRNPRTWTRSYLGFVGGTMSMMFAENEKIGDLAAAAVAFHMAAGGNLAETFPITFQEHHASIIAGDAQLRKMIAAQAAGGDIGGALNWAAVIRGAPIPEPYASEGEGSRQFTQALISENFVHATLGVAEGLLRRLNMHNARY